MLPYSRQKGITDDTTEAGTFTPEFRQMAVDLALKSNQTIAELERELGLSDGLLRQCVKKHRAATAAGKTVEQVADER